MIRFNGTRQRCHCFIDALIGGAIADAGIAADVGIGAGLADAGFAAADAGFAAADVGLADVGALGGVVDAAGAADLTAAGLGADFAGVTGASDLGVALGADVGIAPGIAGVEEAANIAGVEAGAIGAETAAPVAADIAGAGNFAIPADLFAPDSFGVVSNPGFGINEAVPQVSNFGVDFSTPAASGASTFAPPAGVSAAPIDLSSQAAFSGADLTQGPFGIGADSTGSTFLPTEGVPGGANFAGGVQFQPGNFSNFPADASFNASDFAPADAANVAPGTPGFTPPDVAGLPNAPGVDTFANRFDALGDFQPAAPQNVLNLQDSQVSGLSPLSPDTLTPADQAIQSPIPNQAVNTGFNDFFNPNPTVQPPGQVGPTDVAQAPAPSTDVMSPSGTPASTATPTGGGPASVDDLTGKISGDLMADAGRTIPGGANQTFLDKLVGGAESSITRNPLGIALAGGGLAFNMLNPNQPGKAQIDQLSAIAAQQQQQGQRLSAFLENGTLPPGLQTSVDMATQAAKARAVQNAASSGLPTDPSHNSSLAQTFTTIDQQAVATAGQLGAQMLQLGMSETQMASTILNQLLVADQHQAQATGQAIANFAAALGGGGNRINLNLGGASA